MSTRSFLVFRVFAASVGLLAAALPACALPASPDTSVITACVSRSNGATRIVASASACIAGLEASAVWNVTGPTGATGAQGATGTQGTVGQIGRTGLQGPAGADGATGATGTTGPAGPASGTQVWSATFTMPADLSSADGSDVKTCDAGEKLSGVPCTNATVASPQGSSLALGYGQGAPAATGNTAQAFLIAPSTCTISNLRVYVAGPAGPVNATVAVATADATAVLAGAKAQLASSQVSPRYLPSSTALACAMVNDKVPIKGGTLAVNPFYQCASDATTSALLTAGQLVTIQVTPASRDLSLQNAQVMTSFICDTNNTTGTISTGGESQTPLP